MVRKIISFKVKLVLGLALIAAVILWPGTCVNQDARPAVRIQISHEPVTLDYSLAEDGVSLQILPALMVGLLGYDRDYNLKMEVAEKMERLDGGRRYRFTLKPWKWSDGRALTADDFVYAMRRTLSPGTPAKLADLLFDIKNAEAFKRGKVRDFDEVGVRAVAANVLEFSLARPVSFFPHVLTLPVGYPQRKDIVDKLGPQWPEHMVSNGPYKLVRWQHDQRLEVEQNPGYANFDSAAPRRVTFQIIPEEATAVNLFENGRIDVLFKVPSFDLERLRKRGVVQEFPYFATYYLAFDQRQAPWSDRKARLAVAQALNRRSIVESIGSIEHVATSWIPVGLPGHNPAIGVKHDVAAARRNWKGSAGGGMRSLLLGYDTSFRNQTVVERVQAELKEAFGVQVQLRNRDWKTYVRDLGTKPPPVYRFGWLSPFVDAYANLVVFESKNPNNYTGWKNATYDSLLSRIALLDSAQPQRQRLIDEAQKLLIEESVTVIPIFHYVQTIIVAPRVKKFWVNGMGMVDYMQMRVE